ncbi:hypothetical protein ASF87_10185 [Microbacterium sp. Leaf161]|uniref:hypothetical protein n=1 Tax=Microbacterium sp. Leaf161 TaxID=1736281 RepID=UPI0006FE1ED7|nr:hypothetical protein [Microbacterium sp. Leaf161]KQR49153.1 hypothetical protein ASF87_10185 [Microbacterium sp. Leaf161]
MLPRPRHTIVVRVAAIEWHHTLARTRRGEAFDLVTLTLARVLSAGGGAVRWDTQTGQLEHVRGEVRALPPNYTPVLRAMLPL